MVLSIFPWIYLSIQIFCPFKNWDVFLLLNFESSLYILITSLYQIYHIWNISWDISTHTHTHTYIYIYIYIDIYIHIHIHIYISTHIYLGRCIFSQAVSCLFILLNNFLFLSEDAWPSFLCLFPFFSVMLTSSTQPLNII